MTKITNLLSVTLNSRIEMREDASYNSLATRVNHLADLALSPLRYLFRGHVIHFSSEGLYRDKNYEDFKVHLLALAILVVIPATLLGATLRAIALLSVDVRQDVKAAFDYLQLWSKVARSNRVLAAVYRPLSDEVASFKEYQREHSADGSALWDKLETIERFDHLIQNAASVMETLFNQLEGLTHGDAKIMAQLLTYQNRDPEDPIFCFCYFYDSLWDVYRLARNQMTHSVYENPYSHEKIDTLSFASESRFLAAQTRFFDDSLPEGRWRQIYNRFAGKLDEYQSRTGETLRKCLEDGGNMSRAQACVDDARHPHVFIPLPGCPTLLLPHILRKK